MHALFAHSFSVSISVQISFCLPFALSIHCTRRNETEGNTNLHNAALKGSVASLKWVLHHLLNDGHTGASLSLSLSPLFMAISSLFSPCLFVGGFLLFYWYYKHISLWSDPYIYIYTQAWVHTYTQASTLFSLNFVPDHFLSLPRSTRSTSYVARHFTRQHEPIRSHALERSLP